MLTDAGVLRQVVQFLDQHHIPYMLIGGIANALWGQVRATRDADFKVSIGDRSISEFKQLVTQQFPERQTAVPPQLQPPHVIHVWAAPGIAVDFFNTYPLSAVAGTLDRINLQGGESPQNPQ